MSKKITKKQPLIDRVMEKYDMPQCPLTKKPKKQSLIDRMMEKYDMPQ